jgi:hypothetical protein
MPYKAIATSGFVDAVLHFFWSDYGKFKRNNQCQSIKSFAFICS